ncbi:MAG TPA: hypothetical protein VM782_01095 [Stellaceae bacterium]|nr:hypothetical protein [Stellaceae bacterium]
MGDQVDAVDPANIAASFDGGFALRITVLADWTGQAFDGETGDAGPDAVAHAIQSRFAQSRWSVLYVNESTEIPYCDAVQAAGVALLDVGFWPKPGCYEWCADPSGNIRSGGWRPRVAPVAVQDRYYGSIDLSTTFGAFPFTVAGYIDGAQSVWPEAAWTRFNKFPDNPPQPPPRPIKEDTVVHFNDSQGNNYIAAEAADQAGHLLVFRVDPGAEDVRDLTDAASAAAHAHNPADTRIYTIVG